VLSFGSARTGSIDDALITLVYARHLAHDGSLYWNADEGPVEGFTSPLDTFLKAALLVALGGDPLRMAWWTSLVFHVGTALAALAAARAMARHLPATERLALAGLAGFAAAAHPALAEGSVFLLETSLFAFLLVAAAGVLLAAEDAAPVRTVAWIALLAGVVWVRPEGVVFGLGLAWLPPILARASGRPARSLARLLAPALGCAAAVAALVAWRWLTFEAWLPNTYWAKASESRWLELVDGARYVSAFVASHGALGALLVGGAALLPLTAALPGWPRAGDRLGFFTVAALGALGLVMVVASGGDAYAGGRFLVAPLCLGLLALAALAARGPARGRRIGQALLLATALLEGARLAGHAGEVRAELARWPVHEGQLACEREVSLRLAALTAPDRRIGQSDFQMIKYFADEARVLDLAGLNHKEIARRPLHRSVTFGKFDHPIALEYGPEVWFYGYRLASRGQPMALAPMADLLGDPAVADRFIGYPAPPALRAEITARYLPASLAACGRFYNFLLARELAPSFAAARILVGDGEGHLLAAPGP
jgi:hypothetical protein